MTERVKPTGVAARPSEAAEHYALSTPREVEDEMAEQRSTVAGHLQSGAS